jgi:hypothetical protein
MGKQGRHNIKKPKQDKTEGKKVEEKKGTK